MAVRLCKYLGSLFVVDPGQQHENPFGTLLQLVVGQHQVHHHILIDLPEPDHGPGRDHVQNLLLGSRTLHPGAPHDHLGTHLNIDHHIDVDFRGYLLCRDCGDEHGFAASPGSLECRTMHLGYTSTGCVVLPTAHGP